MKNTLRDFKEGIKELSKYNPKELAKFNEFVNIVLSPGKLDLKTKELIAIGAAITTRCKYCIGLHVEKAYKAGATTEEIMEAATVAVLMGGGPAFTYIADLKKAIDLFKDKYE
jgi:AhpD family alkylhydroperoxidase